MDPLTTSRAPPVKILLFTMRKTLMFQSQIPSALHRRTWKPPITCCRQYLWSSIPKILQNFQITFIMLLNQLCPLRLWRRLLQHYAFMCVHGRLQAKRDRRRRCQQELLPGLLPSDEPLKAQRLSHRGIPAHRHGTPQHRHRCQARSRQKMP